MNKIILLLALGSLFSSMYFFFITRDLFPGSVSIILSILFSLVYAMMNKVNRTAEKK